MVSPDIATTYHSPSGEQLGRIGSFFARIGLVRDLFGIEIQTPFTRRIASSMAEQTRYTDAIDRGTFAARAMYAAMGVQGRGVDQIPDAYQPGALYGPQFPRGGVVDQLLPAGGAISSPTNHPW